MKKVLGAALVLAFVAAPAFAYIPSLGVGLTVREGPQTAPIGDPGTRAGALERVDYDGQELILDGTWQYFTFDMNDESIVEGWITGNGVWDNTRGIIDSITLTARDDFSGNYNIWIDDFVETVQAGPFTTDINLTDWEGWPDGEIVGFQNPSYSGSTDGLIRDGDFAGVDNTVAHSGLGSYEAGFRWEVGGTSNWCRWTQWTEPNDGDTVVSVGEPNSVIGIWMMGVPEPGTLSLLGLASLAMLRRRR